MNLPPPPITELTFEQEFEMALFIKQIDKASPENVRDALVASLRQNYLLRSCLSNVLAHWPTGTSTPILTPSNDEVQPESLSGDD